MMASSTRRSSVDATPGGSTPPGGPADGAGTPASTTPAYRVADLGVTLSSSSGPREILRDVDMAVAPGEVVGIVGRSGTGKTTLLRVLGGLLPASRGVVELEGSRLCGPTGTAITVFQDYGQALLPWRTVARNVRLPLEGKLDKAEAAQRVDEALRLVGLDGRGSDYPWRLSGGMQQRVQIARALAMRPRVLLMDEPFGALDAMTKASLQDELLAVRRRTGATVVFITHDIDEAIYLSDRVLVIAGTPGTITLETPTGLPAERDQVSTRERPEFLAVRHRLAEALRVEERSS